MMLRFLAISLGFAAVLTLGGEVSGQDKTKPARGQRGKGATADSAQTEATAGKTETATFGGGCFWCIEAIFERIPGVKDVVPGFAGGTVPNPSYEMVCTGRTGHAEVVRVEYDPEVVTYEKLLKVFWASHNPTTLNSQGDDFGTQYRSIILYHTDAQKRAAQKSYQELTARRAFRDPIVTELVPLTAFYPAEPYHQDYYRNHRNSDYSLFYIVPKLKKLKLKR
jgi:peptide-methionine (S)-S-oxide reductase